MEIDKIVLTKDKKVYLKKGCCWCIRRELSNIFAMEGLQKVLCAIGGEVWARTFLLEKGSKYNDLYRQVLDLLPGEKFCGFNMLTSTMGDFLGNAVYRLLKDPAASSQ